MNLGEYLKNCRETYKRTQPDVAKEAEIEQSYLSKLESGKSIPSNEVFNKLVTVYEIDLEDLVAKLSDQEIKKLDEIKAINKVVSQRKKGRLDTAKNISIAGLVMLTIGVGLLCFSILPDRSQSQYSYRSEGVLKKDEELRAFELVYRDLQQLNDDERLLTKRGELLSRLEQQDVLSESFKGEGYVVNTPEGRRFFKLIGKHESKRDYWNRWFIVPSFMFLVAGAGCFFLSRRWSKSN